MKISFDPRKAAETFSERGLRFEDAAIVFVGKTFSFEDVREDYGETRIISIGLLDGRMVIVGWTPCGDDRHVFTMRKANEREQKKYAALLRD